jgi:O-antigen/teichoic acid export membrane protein
VTRLPGPRQSSLLTDSRLAFAATAGARPLDALRGLIVAGLVGPAAYGLWQVATLVWLWGSNLHLGSLSALARELPALIRDERRREAERLRSEAFTLCVGSALLVALGIACFALSLPADRTLWLLIAAALPAHAAWAFRVEAARAERAFRDLALVAVVGSAGLLIASALLAWRLGIIGVLAAALLHRVGATMAFARLSGWRARPATTGLSSLVRRGLPYWWLVFVVLLYSSADRVLVAAWLSRSELGLYGLSLAATALLRAWARAVDDALQPRLLARSVAAAPKFVRPPADQAPVSITALPHEPLFLWACGLGMLGLPALVELALPEYAGADAALVVLSGAALFPWMAIGLGTRLFALDRSSDLRAAYGLAGAATLAVSGILLHRSYGVQGAAIGMTAGEAVRTGTLLWHVVRHEGASLATAARALGFLSAAPAALLAAVAIAAAAAGPLAGDATGPSGQALAAGLVFSIVWRVLAPLAERARQLQLDGLAMKLLRSVRDGS